MQEPGLYFPFVHIRDDDWLKMAVLYWPSVRRLVPADYLTQDGLIEKHVHDFEAWLNRIAEGAVAPAAVECPRT